MLLSALRGSGRGGRAGQHTVCLACGRELLLVATTSPTSSGWWLQGDNADSNNHLEWLVALLKLHNMCLVLLTEVVPFAGGKLGEAGGMSVGEVFDVVKLKYKCIMHNRKLWHG